jgi:hypothetical protein
VKPLYPRRAARLFVALSLSFFASASFAHTAPPALSDSSTLIFAYPDTLAAPADTIKTAALNDSLPHIHPRDEQGRLSTYTVAPGVTWHYDKPKPLRWALNIPRDIIKAPGLTFRRENTGTLVGLVVSSAALWVADQAIIDWSQDVGKQLGLTPKSTQRTLFRIPFNIGSANLPFEFNVPDNLNSTFYYIGDGWTHLTIASSFWIYGGIKKDNRALRTSSELGEAIFSTGLIVQAMKRLTGRQSPYVATKDRGEWHLFPSYNRYQNFVPNYDAFPTGHLATAMATLTVIADNYPEYHFIRPVGYGLMGLLGYSMLNNGVHWASDYPIGIAIGYGFAKIAVRNGRTRVVDGAPVDAAGKGTGFQIMPRPKPWYRRGQMSPYVYGPFTGASWSLKM